METQKSDRVIGLPKGSLFDSTAKLLQRVGISISVREREFLSRIRGIGFFDKALIARSQDIPSLVMVGIADAGICGWDCVVESGEDGSLQKITELEYGKVSTEAIRVVVFGKTEKFSDESEIRVSSEYPNLARKVFRKAKIDFSHGGTEAKVAVGTHDYGIGVVETGKSLEANGLKIVRTILISPVVLIAREKTPELEIFGEILKGGMESERYQLLKMNVSGDSLEKIMDSLPSMESPTVNRLADGSFAIESVIPRSNLVSVLIAAKRSGARDILVQDINVVLP